jgi:glycosyltransferase involved in cell wall biosynthesis
MNQPIVTAIVSTYNAERFIRGCLDDLVAQTVFNEIEVLIIDSGSPQNESAICMEYTRQYPQIKLIRTEREPLYAAWNRAIPMARGKYLTNANTDDRHRHDFMEVMIKALDDHPDVALTYADQMVSHTENETFEQCEIRSARLRRWPDYALEEIILRCITGSQPMWRKSLHDELGFFDTNYSIAADYDMWLRFTGKYQLLHVPEPLGVFFDSPNTISGANNRLQMDMESMNIKKIYMREAHWFELPGIRKKLAAELFGTGYRYILRQRDTKAAKLFIREAIRLDPTNLSFLKTYVIRCIANITYRISEN